MLVGGKSGPAIIPGDPQNSLLVKRIKANEMPPARRIVEVSVKPMPAAGLKKLQAWIAQVPARRGQRRSRHRNHRSGHARQR